MTNLTSHDEEKLLAATKRAADLVETEGLSPNAAIEKVAREEKFGPGSIRMLCYAHNTGRQVSQFQKSANILDKLAEFPLADADKVIAGIYPSRATEKAAGDGFVPALLQKAAADRHIDYLMPPSWIEKAAEAGVEKKAYDLTLLPKPAAVTAVEPADAARRKYGDYERVKLAYETARRDVLRSRGALEVKVAGLMAYFQQPSRLPFDVVEKTAAQLYGAAGEAVMDLLHERLRSREKRAADTAGQVVRHAVSLGNPVFGLVAGAIAAGRDVVAKMAAAREKEAAYEKAKEGVSGPFAAGRTGAAPARPTSREKEAAGGLLGWGTEVGAIAAGDILAHKATHQDAADDVEARNMFADTDAEITNVRRAASGALGPAVKRAFLNSPAMGAFLGNSVGRIVGDGPKSKNELIEDEWLDLEDPKHQNEMRKIKAHSMLNSMLTDPDSPISGHDPDDVIGAYNEISQLAPRAAEQPAAVKPLLARRLQGNVQPFEAKEITDIEKGITATRNSTPNTSLLKDAPDTLLG